MTVVSWTKLYITGLGLDQGTAEDPDLGREDRDQEDLGQGRSLGDLGRGRSLGDLGLGRGRSLGDIGPEFRDPGGNTEGVGPPRLLLARGRDREAEHL